MIQTILPLIGTVIDRIIPDKNGATKAKQEIEKTLINNAAQLNLAQAETNKIEASHRSVWVAGWRPCLGWVAAFGFAWLFVLSPLLQWILAITGTDIPMPQFQTDVLLELTLAMLGLSGLRTFEKYKKVTK